MKRRVLAVGIVTVALATSGWRVGGVRGSGRRQRYCEVVLRLALALVDPAADP